MKQPDQWVLPVLKTGLDADDSLSAYEREAARIRQALGLEPVFSFD